MVTLLPAGRVTLQARPTFCLSRKQFTTFCNEMSLLLMTTFLHINGPWEKSSCLGLHRGLCLPTWLHPAASQPCINWTEQPSENSRHFSPPPLVSLWNDVWEMTAEISCWWGANTQIWVVFLIGRLPRENCNQKHYSDLGSDTRRRQYEISAVISKRHFAEKPVVASPNFGCFLQVTIEIVVTNQNLDDRSQGKGLNFFFFFF